MVISSQKYLRSVNADHPRMLQNLFEINTRDNPALVHSQVNYTLSRLQEHVDDPVIASLTARFLPKVQVYNVAYTAFFESKELYDSLSELLSDKFANVVRNVHEWKQQVSAYVPHDPMLMRQLFPRGMEVFEIGEDLERISALTVMANRMDGYPELSGLRKEIYKITEELRDIFYAFRSAEKSLSEFTSALEILRINATQGMFYLLNYLLNMQEGRPEQVNKWFDFEELYRQEPKRYEISRLAPSHQFAAPIGSLPSSGTISVENRGTVPLKIFWFVHIPANLSSEDAFVLLEPGEKISLQRSELNSEAENLVVYNPSEGSHGALFLSYSTGE